MAVKWFSMRSTVQRSDRPGASRTAGHPPVPGPEDPGPQPGRGLSTRNDPIAVLIKATYVAATEAVSGNARAGDYQALARLSGHLAAMQRAVYPVARRRLGENQQLLKECRAEARQAEWALRLLECHLAGDASATSRELETVHGWLGQRLDAYRSAERVLVAQVEERLTAPEREHLAHSYRAALAHAPSRPHPRGPHAGWAGRLAFWLHACWDAVLDTMDSRPRVAALREP
jgi:hypothetical protein